MTKKDTSLWTNFDPSSLTDGSTLISAFGRKDVRAEQMGAVVAYHILKNIIGSLKENLEELIATKELEDPDGLNVDIAAIAVDVAKELDITDVVEAFVFGTIVAEAKTEVFESISKDFMPQIGMIMMGFRSGADKEAIKMAKDMVKDLTKIVEDAKEACDIYFVS